MKIEVGLEIFRGILVVLGVLVWAGMVGGWDGVLVGL